jgi:hypothetical protein
MALSIKAKILIENLLASIVAGLYVALRAIQVNKTLACAGSLNNTIGG